MRRHALPALAALALCVAGPTRQTFETTHLPREVAAAALAAALVLGLRRPVRLDRLDAALLAVAGVAVVSAAASLSPAYAWRPALLTLAAVAIALGARARTDRPLWLLWLGAAIALLAALGLIEALGWARWSPQGRAPSALLGQRNTLAHVLVLGSPIVWCLGLGARRAAGRAGWLLIAALAAAVIVMTRSRGAWLAFPFVLAVFVTLGLLRGEPARRALVIPAVTLAGAAIAALLPVALWWRSPSPYLDSLSRLVDASSGSGAGRLEQWRRALALVPEAPLLGTGPGNAFVALTRESNRFLNSDPVALLVERGALGVLAALLALALLLAAWRRAPGGIAGLPLVAAVTAGVLVTGTFDAVTQLPAAAVLTAVVGFAGLPRASEPAGTPRPVFAWLAAGFFCMGALGCCLALASRLISSAPATTFDDLERAVRLDPTDGLTRLELVTAQVSAGRCEDAGRHLPALQRQLPRHDAVRKAAEAYRALCPPAPG